MAILGDTRKTPNTLSLAKAVDVLVHESTFEPDEAKLARQYYHATNLQAAHLAKDAGAKKLLLNHISARYLGKGVVMLEKSAQKVFANTHVVHDLEAIDVPFAKESGHAKQ